MLPDCYSSSDSSGYSSSNSSSDIDCYSSSDIDCYSSFDSYPPASEDTKTDHQSNRTRAERNAAAHVYADIDCDSGIDDDSETDCYSSSDSSGYTDFGAYYCSYFRFPP